MFTGEVIGIFLAPDEGADVVEVSEVRAVSGRGLEGDRYYNHAGKFSHKENPGREVTLIESEAIEALAQDHGVNLALGESRRNVVTSGVPLNHLVGRDFEIGEVVLKGIELCEPCGYLEGLTKAGVKQGLLHRGGLNAQIVREGVIRRGDEVKNLD